MTAGERTRTVACSLARGVAIVAVTAVALQLYIILRVASMAVIGPESTTLQRSEAWRLANAPAPMTWRQQPVGYDRMSANLKRAVVASEDAGFMEHGGVEWEALMKARDRNAKAQAAADRANERAAARQRSPDPNAAQRVPKVVGGSTITQQLAKNLFLSGERHVVRKAQELVIAFWLETLLDKRRILEIYLNSVEWGEGVFGAEAAAARYFRTDAARLSAAQAAQLAVMLPAPKRFEKRPGSPYVTGRSATIAARLGGVDVP